MTTTLRKGNLRTRRRAVCDRAASELGAVERDFVRDVERLLGDVPPHHRRELLAAAVDHLAERPPARDNAQLWQAVGRPSTYAAELRSIPATTEPTGVDRLVGFSQRRWVRTASALLVVAAVVSGFLWWRHVELPEVSNSCGGVVDAEAEQRTAARVTEYVVEFEEGERFGVPLCFSTQHDGTVRLIGTAYPDLPYDYRISMPAGVRIRDALGQSVREFDTGERIDLPIDSSTWETTVWFEMTCAARTGTESFDVIPFEFGYQGREFTVLIDLLDTITVAMSADDCPQLS